jgi:hypothetical protein
VTASSNVFTPPPPRAVRGAVGVWCAAAVFGLIHVGYLWFIRDTIVRNQAELRKLPTDQVKSAVESTLITVTVVFAVLGLLLAAGAFVLPRGKRWIRPVLTALGVLLVLASFAAGLNPATLVVFGLATSATLLTWHPTTTAWLASVRALRERDE